jgi:hypothetical protein
MLLPVKDWAQKRESTSGGKIRTTGILTVPKTLLLARLENRVFCAAKNPIQNPDGC